MNWENEAEFEGGLIGKFERAVDRRDQNRIRGEARQDLTGRSNRIPRFHPKLPDLQEHPEGAWLLGVSWPAALEVFTRSNDSHSFFDNAMLRDYPSDCPFYPESSIKGLVHAACGYWIAQHRPCENEDALVQAWMRLFGSLKSPPEKEVGWEQWLDLCLDDDLDSAGHLRFFPLFFERTKFRATNSHAASGDRRVGSAVIPWEMASEPMDVFRNGRPLAFFRPAPDLALTSTDSEAERTLMEGGLKFLFEQLGFGAKGATRLHPLPPNPFHWTKASVAQGVKG